MNFASSSEERILLTWRAPAMRRILVSAAIGGAAAAITGAAGGPWQFSLLGAWNSGAVTYLLLVWMTISRFTPEQTAAMATIEDNSRRWSSVVLLTASTASLLSVAFGLHRANQAHGGLRFWLTFAVITGIVCSWTVVHTVYVLRYAHIYYSTAEHGILFPGNDKPDYMDFAYVSFTLGMTFQVSDNSFTSRQFRRVALVHCLLSYVFGTVVIATSINVLAGLV